MCRLFPCISIFFFGGGGGLIKSVKRMCMYGWVKNWIVTCEKMYFWCEKRYKWFFAIGSTKTHCSRVLFIGVTFFLLKICDLKTSIQKEKHMSFFSYWLLVNIIIRKWGTGKSQKEPRNSHWKCYVKKAVVKIFWSVHRKTHVLGLLLIKLFQHRCFSVNSTEFLRTTILKNISARLLLNVFFNSNEEQ